MQQAIAIVDRIVDLSDFTGTPGDGEVVVWDIGLGKFTTRPVPKGETGPQGVVGAQGATGAASTVAGPQGVVGAQGATGAASTVAGPQGNVGPQGDVGPQGVVGPQGATGAASVVPGPQGATGAASTVAGPQGAPGADSTVAGPQGAPGADSTVAGPRGATGPQGDVGATGAPGAAAGSTVPYSFTGGGTPVVVNDACAWLYVEFNTTAARLTLSCKTAPTGNFQVAVRRSVDSGATFPDTVGSVTVGSGTKLATTTTFTSAALSAGDYLRLDVISVNAAADWTVRLSTKQ